MHVLRTEKWLNWGLPVSVVLAPPNSGEEVVENSFHTERKMTMSE